MKRKDFERIIMVSIVSTFYQKIKQSVELIVIFFRILPFRRISIAPSLFRSSSFILSLSLSNSLLLTLNALLGAVQRNSTLLAHLQCSLYIVQNPLALCRTLIRVLHDSKCGMETAYFEFVWDAEKNSDATKSLGVRTVFSF